MINKEELELTEKYMPTIERFEQVQKEIFYPIPSDMPLVARMYAAKIAREAIEKTLSLLSKEEEAIRTELLERIDTIFSDKITKGEMVATHAWQTLKESNSKGE